MHLCVQKSTAPIDKKPVKGKTVQDTDIKLPEEGWKPSAVTSYRLGLCTMDTMSLLESKRSITVVSPLTSSMEDKTKLYQSGLVRSLSETDKVDNLSNGGGDVRVTVKYTLEQL